MNALTENLAIIGTIDPDAYTAAAYNTDVIDMKDWREVIFIVMTGDLGASATLDFVVKGDTTSGGSFSTTITGKTATQLTQAGSDSDKQVIIRVTSEEVAAQSLRYLRGTMTVATATSDCGAIVLGVPAHYAPITAPAQEKDLGVRAEGEPGNTRPRCAVVRRLPRRAAADDDDRRAVARHRQILP